MRAGTPACTCELAQDVVPGADFLLCLLDVFFVGETSVQGDSQVDRVVGVFKCGARLVNHKVSFGFSVA